LRLPCRQQQNRKESTWIKVPEQRNKGIGEKYMVSFQILLGGIEAPGPKADRSSRVSFKDFVV
jgi:hypothetical protein